MNHALFQDDPDPNWCERSLAAIIGVMFLVIAVGGLRRVCLGGVCRDLPPVLNCPATILAVLLFTGCALASVRLGWFAASGK